MQKDQGSPKVPSSSSNVENRNSQLKYQTTENSSSPLKPQTVENSSNQLKYKNKLIGYVVLLMLDILSNFL